MTFLQDLIESEDTVKQFEREYYLNIKPQKLAEVRPEPEQFQFGLLPAPIKGCR